MASIGPEYPRGTRLQTGLQDIISTAVTGVDWLIVAFAALLALYGYIQGFIVGVLSLAGFALGAFLGTRIAPLLLSNGSRSPYSPLFGLVGALIVGGVLATGLEGVGLRVRSALRITPLRTVDGLLGALLTGCVGLGIAWIVGSVALQSTSSAALRQDIQRSTILHHLDQILPPSGPILHALARFDPLPSVHGPAADVPAPTTGILAAPAVKAARASVVRVVGTACGLGIEGSGWVAGPDLVVTNAHVVAGEGDTVVEPGGNTPGRRAHVVAFNPHDDIAILRVPGLHERVLPLAADPRSGTAAAIMGYPEDGPFDVEPGRIGQTTVLSTEDAYGNGPVMRRITSLRGRVRPGNSGGPMIDSGGHVVATVFAAIVGGSGGNGGFAVPNALVRAQLAAGAARHGTVSTQSCAG
jgi:S1-C subfamily serine protease